MTGRRGFRNVPVLAEGAVHVWAVARPRDGDPLTRVLSLYGRPGEGQPTVTSHSGKPRLDGWAATYGSTWLAPAAFSSSWSPRLRDRR